MLQAQTGQGHPVRSLSCCLASLVPLGRSELHPPAGSAEPLCAGNVQAGLGSACLASGAGPPLALVLSAASALVPL